MFKSDWFTNRIRMILSVGDETSPEIRLCTFSGSLITKVLLVKNFAGDAHARRDFIYFSWINRSDKWGEIFTVLRKFRNQLVLEGSDGTI